MSHKTYKANDYWPDTRVEFDAGEDNSGYFIFDKVAGNIIMLKAPPKTLTQKITDEKRIAEGTPPENIPRTLRILKWQRQFSPTVRVWTGLAESILKAAKDNADSAEKYMVHYDGREGRSDRSGDLVIQRKAGEVSIEHREGDKAWELCCLPIAIMKAVANAIQTELKRNDDEPV